MLDRTGGERTYGPKEMDLVCLYTFIGCGAAVLAGADYNAVGILIIVFLYRFRNSRRKQTVAAGVLGFIETLFPYSGSRGAGSGAHMVL